jgi:hypothetical protein
MTVSDITSTHELATRQGDGLRVRLLWNRASTRLWVMVDDFKDGTAFAVDVRNPGDALDVFHHPYAYAAHYRINPISAGASRASAIAQAAA